MHARTHAPYVPCGSCLGPWRRGGRRCEGWRSVPHRTSPQARCTLFRNVRSIAAEFAALLLLCTYVVSHGLPDAQRIAAAAAAADRADGGGGASVCGAEREGTTRPLVMATENGVCRG